MERMSDPEKKLVKELQKAGYKYIGINHLFKQEELPEKAVKIILNWFPELYREHLGTGDHLLRSLIAAKDPFDPQPLIDFFERNRYNSTVMWTVAHVLAVANTTDISDWLRNQLLKKHQTFERAGLVRGLIKKGNFKTTAELKKFMKKIFDKYPYEVLALFKKVGTSEDIPFLEEKLKPVERREQRDISKMIISLNKRNKNTK